MGKREYHHEHDDHLNADINHVSRDDGTTGWHQRHAPHLNLKKGGSGMGKQSRVSTGRSNAGVMIKPGQHSVTETKLRKKYGKSQSGSLTPGGHTMRNSARMHAHDSKPSEAQGELNNLALARYKTHQRDNAILAQYTQHEFKPEMPSYLKSLVDIDGDGHVDSEEYSLMSELANVQVTDIDGDGQIDEHEIMVAKQLAGKRILAKRFVDRNKGKMWRYAKEFNNNVPYEDSIDKMVYAKDYNGLMTHLKLKERVMRLSSSDGLKGAFHTPQTNRAVTGRNIVHKPQYLGLR